MSRPTIGVLALQGDVREHLAMLATVGADPVPVRTPVELATVEGLVLPGGESTTIAKLAGIFGVFDPLRTAIADGLPVFGTCAGMILLADRILDGAAGQPTLGGLDATVRRNAFGRQVDSFETEVELTGFDAPHRCVLIRAPWVEECGPDVEVIGRVAGGEHVGRIVAVRQDRLLATSFHPEVTDDARLHHRFLQMVREAGNQPAS